MELSTPIGDSTLSTPTDNTTAEFINVTEILISQSTDIAIIDRAKIISVACTFFISLACGIFYTLTLNQILLLDPKVFEYITKIFSYLNAFISGLYFAVVYLHLLPEVRMQIITGLFGSGKQYNYPLAELSLCVGFLIMALADQGFIYLKSKLENNSDIDDELADLITSYEDIEMRSIASNASAISGDDDSQGQASSNTSHNGSISSNDRGDQPLVSSSELYLAGDQLTMTIMITLSMYILKFLLIGLVLGLQSTTHGVIQLLCIILLDQIIQLYKICDDFSTKLNIGWKELMSGMVVLSFIIPLGIMIGYGATRIISPRWTTAEGFTQGIISGSLIFTTLIELNEGLLQKRPKYLLKLLLFGLGFMTLALIQLTGDDSEIEEEMFIINPVH